MVASFSQVSARRNASSTSRRSDELTDRSPPADTTCRADWLARSQLTGPPDHDSIWPSCWSICPRSGMPAAPPPKAANRSLNGSPDGPDSPPAEPASLESPRCCGRLSSSSSSDLKPNGTSLIGGTSGRIAAESGRWPHDATVRQEGCAMGRQPSVVRARRNGEQTRRRGGERTHGGDIVVAVVGAASGPGRRLTARLAAARDDVRRVVAIDTRRGDIDGVTWRVLDYTHPALVSRLAVRDTVVHTAVEVGVTDDPNGRSRRNVRGVQAVLTASAAAGVGRVIVVTSAMVYGALPDNPIPLPDDAPLRATEDGALLSDLLQIEAL